MDKDGLRLHTKPDALQCMQLVESTLHKQLVVSLLQLAGSACLLAMCQVSLSTICALHVPVSCSVHVAHKRLVLLQRCDEMSVVCTGRPM